ncbi:uncharacterized protein LOC119777933 [Cyprinodon tularosa]|uniref:uncharacterized protein LOC119777933 n=1 Tax=Cyprinodon tularosa TaxID=77115 RepID=UPI0018E2135D|nr:uncharacterized protein LOC119777933 [Cyprinodon tularosa]
MFGGDGKETRSRTLQLCVQAPVSSVKLVHQCWPPGQIKVSCLSEGDSPQYSWTLDGKTPTDSELLSGNNQTKIIVLKPNISGLLFCSVRNQVSSSSNEINIPDCGFLFINCTVNGTTIAKWVYKENNTLCVEPTTGPPTVKHSSVGLLPIIAGVLTTLVIILVVCIAFICYFKKKKSPRAVEEDDQELTYADVRVVKNQGKKVELSADVDVEYGQVKFSKRQRPERANPIVEDTLYAQVNKGR